MKNRPQTNLSSDQIGETFQEVLGRNIARRSFFKGTLISAPLMLAAPGILRRHFAQAEEDNGLKFKPIDLDNQDRVLATNLTCWMTACFTSQSSTMMVQGKVAAG